MDTAATHTDISCQSVLGSLREPFLPLGSSPRFWCQCCWQLKALPGRQQGLKCGLAFVAHHPQVKAIQRHPKPFFLLKLSISASKATPLLPWQCLWPKPHEDLIWKNLGNGFFHIPEPGARREDGAALALLSHGAPSHTNPNLLQVSQDTSMGSGMAPLNLCWENHPETTQGLGSSCKQSPEHPTTLEMPEAAGEATLVHNAPSSKRSPGPLPAEGETWGEQSLSDTNRELSCLMP